MIKKLLMFVAAVIMLLSGVLNVAEAANFPAFSTKTIDGQVVTNSVFSGHKLTMINIWATWCPPCVGEMPDLGKLGRNMPNDTQLIGLLLDAKTTDEINVAKSILSKAKANFLQMLPSKEMTPFLNSFDYIPTTVFVDSHGRIIGDLISGACTESKYRSSIEAALKKL